MPWLLNTTCLSLQCIGILIHTKTTHIFCWCLVGCWIYVNAVLEKMRSTLLWKFITFDKNHGCRHWNGHRSSQENQKQSNLYYCAHDRKEIKEIWMCEIPHLLLLTRQQQPKLSLPSQYYYFTTTWFLSKEADSTS